MDFELSSSSPIRRLLLKMFLILYFYSWIVPNWNADIFFSSKIAEVVPVEHYRPIDLATFKFKIISKIIADGLDVVAPNIFLNQ